MWWVKLLRFHQCIKIDGDVYNCRCAILPASSPQWAQKSWSCWCNANGTPSEWTAACTDTRCQTVASSSQYGNVNKILVKRKLRFREGLFKVRRGSHLEDFQRPDTSRPYDALCFTKIKLFLRFLHEWCRRKFGAVWGTRRATKATQAVQYFPQEVSCGTSYAFARNSTRDCTCHIKLITPRTWFEHGSVWNYT